MSIDPAQDTCVVCGKDVTNAAGVAHIYHAGKPFPVCCPMCMSMFQRAPARFASGEHPQTIVEELLADLKWKETGR